jgi:predicted double-glycine peptidase
MLLSLCAAGCALSPTPDVSTFAESSGSNSFEVFDREVNSSALVLPVVHDRQTRGPSCGAHALASVVNYWRGPGTLTGDALYHDHPPADGAGYSMTELIALAQQQRLLASAVRMPEQGLIRELESGRPVLVPVRLPSIYVQQRALPGGDAPVIGVARNALINRAGRVSELTNTAVVNHYLLVTGYQDDTFVVVEPVMGYRTIRFSTLARYRQAFGDAAIVFSGPPGSRPASGASS